MKKLKFLSIFLFVGVVALLIVYFVNRFSFVDPLPYYEIENSTKDSVLTIGIIGDSWAADNALDSSIHRGLLKNGINNRVISSGHPGAKSKLVYQNLFKDSSDVNSSRFIIEANPHYCILIAGVNDAASQLGAGYYSHHMKQIINTLMHYNIKPIVIQLPEFGVKETINEMNFIKRTRNIVSAYLTNKGEIDNINSYRTNFINELETHNLRDKIIMVNFNDVCKEYIVGSEIYEDHSHLNKKGNIILSRVSVEVLLSNIKKIIH